MLGERIGLPPNFKEQDMYTHTIFRYSPQMRRRRSMGVRDAEWKEGVGEYRLSIYLPQLRRGDLQMAVQGNQLMIQGTRTVGNSWWGMRQIVYRRSFALPADADPERISGRLEWGKLRIRIPRQGHSLPAAFEGYGTDWWKDFQKEVRVFGKVVRRGIDRILHILKHGV